jgi:hypothetical protein
LIALYIVHNKIAGVFSVLDEPQYLILWLSLPVLFLFVVDVGINKLESLYIIMKAFYYAAAIVILDCGIDGCAMGSKVIYLNNSSYNIYC